MPIPAIAVPDSARVTIRGTLHGSPASMSLWAQRTVPPVTSLNLLNLALRVAVLQRISFRNALSSDYHHIQVDAQDYSAGPGAIQTSTFATGDGLAGPGMPSNIALRLFNDTTPPRSSHRSTTWVPGIPISRVVDDQLDHSWADGMAIAWSNLVVNLPIFGWRYVAVSLIEGGLPRAVGLVFPITTISVASYTVAPRRKRLPDH
jgi:hypothetical protein